MDTIVKTCDRCGSEYENDGRPCPNCEVQAEAPAKVELQSYVMSGKCSPAQFGVLAGLSLILAIVFGIGLHYIAKVFNGPLIDSAFTGLFLSFAVCAAVKKAHCRSLPIALVVAFLAGIVMYGTRIVLDSQDHRPMLVRFLTRDLIDERGMTPEAAQTKAEHWLNPVRTARIYLQYMAFVGVRLVSSHDSSYTTHGSGSTSTVTHGGIELQGTTYWLLQLAEFLISGFVVASMIKQIGMNDPYCENCGRWMDGKRLAKLNLVQAPLLAKAINDQEWDKLVSIKPMAAVDEQNHAGSMTYSCNRCENSTVLAYAMANTRTTSLRHVWIGRSLADDLRAKAPSFKKK